MTGFLRSSAIFPWLRRMPDPSSVPRMPSKASHGKRDDATCKIAQKRRRTAEEQNLSASVPDVEMPITARTPALVDEPADAHGEISMSQGGAEHKRVKTADFVPIAKGTDGGERRNMLEERRK